MQNLFTDARHQYIDSNGKTRVLFYDGGVSLSVSPIPPLDLPELTLTRGVKRVSLQVAMEFVYKYSLKITEKHNDLIEGTLTGSGDVIYENDGKIDGLWVKVNESISFGYIFIDRNASIPEDIAEALDKIPFSEGVQNPILPYTQLESALTLYRKNYKIAEYLKHYSLIEFANYPNSFGNKNFSIRPNHDYAVPVEGLGTRLKRKNAYFYSGGKIVVHDEETRDRLILYAKVSAYNDPSILKRYKEKQVIDGPSYYKCLSDFRQASNQLLFSNPQDLIAWKSKMSTQRVDENLVSPIPLPNETKPYYYRNLNIENGRLIIIQNTIKGDFPSALAVSKNWEIKHVNTGYNTLPRALAQEDKDISFEVFTEEGMSHFSYADKSDNKIILKIFAYLYGEGSYGAALFL